MRCIIVFVCVYVCVCVFEREIDNANAKYLAIFLTNWKLKRTNGVFYLSSG